MIASGYSYFSINFEMSRNQFDLLVYFV